MEEIEKGKKGHKLSIIEKIDRLLTFVVGIPILGIFLKKGIDKLTEKGAEKLERKVESFLGIHVEEHGKGFGDEILMREAIRVLDVKTEQPIIEAFRIWLRKKDPTKADAFTLGIAKAIKSFERQVKKTVSKGGKNGKGKPSGPQEKEETSRVEYDHSWSTNFLQRLISYETNEAKEEFVFEGENFKSLIQPPKGPSPIGRIAKKIYEEVKPMAYATADKITEGQNANLAELDKDSADYLQRAKERYEKRRSK